MTKRELINALEDPHKQIPDNAEIEIYDADANEIMPITGMIYGGKNNRVELTSSDDS